MLEALSRVPFCASPLPTVDCDHAGPEHRALPFANIAEPVIDAIEL